MSDQLSLQLPPESPALPSGLRPMEARPLASPFDSADHLFQPLWGGLRALAFVTANRAPEPGAEGKRPDVRRPGTTSVVLLDGEGQDRTASFPELAAVAASLRAGTAVLDGEIVVVDRAGRLDPEQLAARLAGRGRDPAIFLAFDLLHLDGRSLLATPLHRRRELLRRLVAPGGSVLVVPAIEGDGRALHAAVTVQGLAGVLARVRTSPYLPGIRSRLWRFVPAGRAARTEAGAVGPATPDEPEQPLDPGAPRPSSTAGPLLAVIARLPLDEP